MFVQKIGGLDKTRFGINFKAEDIKCELYKKENKKNINKDVKNKFK
jgi:hypothetical protein